MTHYSIQVLALKWASDYLVDSLATQIGVVFFALNVVSQFLLQSMVLACTKLISKTAFSTCVSILGTACALLPCCSRVFQSALFASAGLGFHWGWGKWEEWNYV